MSINLLSEGKKRGRKKKDEKIQNITTINEKQICSTVLIENKPPTNILNDIQKNTDIKQKRGRRAKNSKLILPPQSLLLTNNSPPISNVILHLKCSLNDLKHYNNNFIDNQTIYNPEIPLDILKYNNKNNDFFVYEDNNVLDYAYTSKNNINTAICSVCNNNNTIENENYDNVSIKNINLKLKNLKINLFKNNLNDKKSSCFWCTYDYDNVECYIPKYEIDKSITAYGSFCRPECAVAFLLKENIDDSTKFERYHLLNQIYGRIYNYNNNIKPAPNPFYLLDKFYGNLTIQEYRKLLKTEHLLIVIDKPLTRILPELHEDNDMSYINNMVNNSDKQNSMVYKVKKASVNCEKKTIII
jgi:hypothetical protein